MTSKKLFVTGVFGVALIGGGVLFAQKPVENIDPHRHSNLAEAQHHLQQAWGKTDEAQRENKDELGGHAQKAKEHIEEADRELKLAAEFADHRK
jgi:F0F1-type ATP synthase membrane subunit b/b'